MDGYESTESDHWIGNNHWYDYDYPAWVVPRAGKKMPPMSTLKPMRRHYWHYTMHTWCSPGKQAAIVTVLLIEQRLDQVERTQSAAALQMRGVDVPAVLPSLPHDMWLLLLTHVRRSDLGSSGSKDLQWLDARWDELLASARLSEQKHYYPHDDTFNGDPTKAVDNPLSHADWLQQTLERCQTCHPPGGQIVALHSYESAGDGCFFEDATNLVISAHSRVMELVLMAAKIVSVNPSVTKLFFSGQDFKQPGAVRALGIGK